MFLHSVAGQLLAVGGFAMSVEYGAATQRRSYACLLPRSLTEERSYQLQDVVYRSGHRSRLQATGRPIGNADGNGQHCWPCAKDLSECEG